MSHSKYQNLNLTHFFVNGEHNTNFRVVNYNVKLESTYLLFFFFFVHWC